MANGRDSTREFAPPMAATLLAVAGLLALPPAPASAGDDAAQAVRDDLAALVEIAAGLPREYDGPSPTALVRRLLARKERPVKPVLEEAWKLAGTKGAPAQDLEVALERVIRHLYGTEVKEAKVEAGQISFGGTVGVVYESAGLVLVREGGTGARGKVMGEAGWDRDDAPRRRTFAELLKGGKFRKEPKPDFRALWKQWEGGELDRASESEKRSFVLGLGEACGSDPTQETKLLDLVEKSPADVDLLSMVAAAGSDRSRALLRSRIAPMAARVAGGREAAMPLLTIACRGVSRADPDAFREEIGKLPDEDRKAAYHGAGFRIAASFLADAWEAAADDSGRRAPVIEMVELIRKASYFRQIPAAADMPRVVRAFTAAVQSDDAELSRYVEHGAYWLFYAGTRDGTANVNISSNNVAINGTGERLGPYPDMALLLRRLDEDLQAGRLTHVEGAASLFDRPVPQALEGFDRAWSGFDSPQPMMAKAEKSSPVHLKGERTETGLKLTFTNAGKTPFAVNPVGFRYGTAEYIPVTVTGETGGTREFTQFVLEFGMLGGWDGWQVPASVLVTVPPGGSWSVEVPVNEAHRDADHVGISVHIPFRIPEGSDIPVLGRVGESWIR